jgi:hypothetical protein
MQRTGKRLANIGKAQAMLEAKRMMRRAPTWRAVLYSPWTPPLPHASALFATVMGSAGPEVAGLGAPPSRIADSRVEVMRTEPIHTAQLRAVEAAPASAGRQRYFWIHLAVIFAE